MKTKFRRLSDKEREEVSIRMAEKQKWKELPGNRYTPAELKNMSKALKGHFRLVISKRTGLSINV